MSELALFLIVGLGTGAVYVALALGLVVVFKGTGVINFAQGAMAMWSVYIFDEIRKTGDFVLPVGSISVGTNFATAMVCALVSGAVVGLIAHLLVFKPLRTAPPLAKVVASVGVMITIQAAVVLRFSANPRAVAPILPNEAISWGQISFSRDRLYLAGIAVLLTLGLWAYFRFARSGLAIRAAAENELGASLSGYSPDVLAGSAWVLASTISGAMVILAAPSTGLNPVNYTLLIVPALAVALVGRLKSLAVVCISGLALGAFQSELTHLSSQEWWPEWAVTGLGDAVPFVIIIVILFAAGRSLPTRGSTYVDDLPDVRVPKSPLRGAIALTVAGGAAVMLTTGSYRFAVVTSMIMAVIALSLVLLTGYVGQISLAQMAFAGTAAFALSRLAMGAGIPFPFAPLLALVISTLLGVFAGIPALRIRGAQLAVVTLAAAVAIQQFIFSNPLLSPAGGNKVPSPELFGIDLGVRRGADLLQLPFAFMVLGVLVIVVLGVANLARGDTGRAFLAVRSNERAAAGVGINVAATKLLAFAMASFIAGIGGCLIAYSRGLVSPASFTVFAGVSILAFAYLGGITSVSGALIAGLFAPLGAFFVMIDRTIELGEYYFLLTGIGLVVATIFNPQGIAEQIYALYGVVARSARKRRGQSEAVGREMSSQDEAVRA